MKLVVAPLALAEVHDAAAFYTLKANAELGLTFVAEFERTAKFVFANPLLGAVFRGTRRRYFFRRFPYRIRRGRPITSDVETVEKIFSKNSPGP